MRSLLSFGRSSAPLLAVSLSSASNFAAGLLAVALGTKSEFGAYSVATAVVLLPMVLMRDSIVEPVLSLRAAGRSLSTLVFLLALPVAAGIAFIAQLVDDDLTSSLTTVGVALPLLLVQDTNRALLIYARQSKVAVVLEILWIGIGAIAIGIVHATSGLSTPRVLACWAAGGVVSALAGLRCRSLLDRSHNVRETWAVLRPRLADVVGATFVQRGLAHLGMVLSAAVLGLSAYGGLRASMLLMTPMSPAIQTARVVALRPDENTSVRLAATRRVYRLLVAGLAAWTVLMVVARVGLRDVEVFSRAGTLVIALIGVAMIVQAVAARLEIQFRLRGLYRELSKRYGVSSPIGFVILVGSAEFGLVAAAVGILAASAVQAMFLLSRRGGEMAAPSRELVTSGAPARARTIVSPRFASASAESHLVSSDRVETSTDVERIHADFTAGQWRRRHAAVGPSSFRLDGDNREAPALGSQTGSRDEAVLTMAVIAVLRPFTTGGLAVVALAALIVTVIWAFSDAMRHPRSVQRWLSPICIWPIIAISAASLLWTVALGSTLNAVFELGAVSLVSVVICRRLPPERRFVPLFRGTVAVAALNLAAYFLGLGATQQAAFVGFFEQKNALGRAAFLVALTAVVLSITSQIGRRVTYGACLLALALALLARSGTPTLLIIGAVTLAPIIRLRVRSLSSRQFTPIVMFTLAIALTAYAMAGTLDIRQIVLKALGRDLVQNTAAVRESLWSSVLEQVRQRPILGHGLGSFELGDVLVWTGRFSVRWDAGQSHNGYLDVAYQLGVVGLLVVLASQAYLLARLWSMSRRKANVMPWFGAAVALFLLNDVLNIAYSTFLGRLAVFWLVQSVFYVTCTDVLAQEGSPAPPTAKRIQPDGVQPHHTRAEPVARPDPI